MKAKIFLTFVCFLQFCVVIHSSFSSDLKEEEVLYDKLFLCITSKSERKIMYKFQQAAKSLGYYCEVKQRQDWNLKNILEFYNNITHDVVVNFNVINYGHLDKHIEQLLNDLTEDMVTDQYGIINESLSMSNCNETDFYKRSCQDPAFNRHSKLFIGSLEKHQALYNVFDTITDIKTDYRKKIVVCLEERKKENCIGRREEDYQISCIDCNKEFECSTDIIAIVASSPESIKRTCDESIPAIFYDTLYIEPNHGTHIPESDVIDYISSTTIMHWRDLSLTLKSFLKQYEPIPVRFAIISDDHPLSNKLKNDQIDYFKQQHTLFATRDCCDGDLCNFKEALLLYKEAGAKAIIVNVGKHNMDKFIQSAQAADMTDQDIFWIFPGYRNPFPDIESFMYKLYVYFPKATVITKAIELVKNEYTNVLGNEILFRKAISNHQPKPDYYNNIGKSEFNRRPISIKIPSCALNTDNFFSPCNDWTVLYIIIVIIIFLLLVFGILVFFNQIEMNTLAYKPLHKPPPLWRQLLRRETPQQPRQGFQMTCRRRF